MVFCNHLSKRSLQADSTRHHPRGFERRDGEHLAIIWPKVARSAFEEKVEYLELLDLLSADSEPIDEHVEEIAESLDTNVAQELAER